MNEMNNSQDMDQSDMDGETWTPTLEEFTAFRKRDYDLAKGNVRLMLSHSSVHIKDLKCYLLHSSDTVDRVLFEGVKDGSIVENNNMYSLASNKRP